MIWAEIDLGAIAHNVRELRQAARPEARFMAVVKANGYGHGAVEVARAALKSGADLLGVARISEAVSLRNTGIESLIHVFGYMPPDMAPELIDHDLIGTVYTLENARILSRAGQNAGKKIKVHIKVDTGMGRLGMASFPDDELNRSVQEIQAIVRLKGLEAEGIYTHFAASDEKDKTYARIQLERFLTLTDHLRRHGIEFQIRHCANSGAIIDLPETHLDMVRAGISLYGLYPSADVDRTRVILKPAMTLKSRIIQVKKVGSGFKVSYGMTYQTDKPTVIASVSAGYADGLNRLLTNQGHMLVHGMRSPIAGRVCMDLTMLDVGHIPDAAIGDEVVIFGCQGGQEIHVDEIASCLKTINYEIVSTITQRVARVYI
jgi:alanine racemase